MAKLSKNTKYVYGLDIGTRSIVGTVGYRVKDRFVVVAQKVKEHESRAMLDGQIHDIEAVSGTIRDVTEALSKEVDKPLKQVCIAAAGRVLKTVNVHVDMEFEEDKNVNGEDVHMLNSYGIEKAYEVFGEQNGTDTHFYCVGYSVVHYLLNDYPISNLENHKASKIGADIIATFLPDDVVDGLYKAVEMADLEVANLTLEPIAAIELAIPDMYRMLNIALIDVGAGTSDISITRDGSIVAYGMLPVAGDRLTESVAKHCLVDFATAETIKRGIENSDTVEYKDIMGHTQKITAEEILNVLNDDLEVMAEQASDKIKELNGGKSVSAVFVVGGGGRIAHYTDKVAEHLGITPDRCAVRGEEVMGKVDFMDDDAERDSLMVTPIGICLNYYEQSNNFIFVTFNKKRIKLYDNGHLAIVDAALTADFPNDDLFPKRGKSLFFTLNGKDTEIRGSLGESAAITHNGETADINTQIRSNDVVEVVPSTVGEDASMTVGKLPDFSGSITIKIDGKELVLPKLANVNGELVVETYEIKPGDKVELLNYYTVSQVLSFMDIPEGAAEEILVNREKADLDEKVYDNFTISIKINMQRIMGLGDEAQSFEELPDSDEVVIEKNKPVDPDSFAALPEDEEYVSGAYAPPKPEKEEEEDKEEENTEEEKPEEAKPEEDKTEEKTDDESDMRKDNNPLMSALEKARKNAEQVVTHIEFERAEEALANMVQSNAGLVTEAKKAEESVKEEAPADENIEEKPDEDGIMKSTDPDISDNEKEVLSALEKVKEQKYVEKILDRKEEKEEKKEDDGAVHVTVNGGDVALTGKKDYIYVDVFDLINFDLSKPQGKSVETLLNGKKAAYTDILHEGDVLDIHWRD